MRKLLEKLSRSRDLTVSVLIHGIIVLLLAGTVLFKVVVEPPDPSSGGPIVLTEDLPQKPVDQKPNISDSVDILQKIQPSTAPTTSMTETIKSITPSNLVVPDASKPIERIRIEAIFPQKLVETKVDGIPREARLEIKQTADQWKQPGGGGKYNFTAFLAQYTGGDWDSTVRIKDQKVVGGSLPNLLYLMNKWSKDRITTNEDKIKVVRLDNGEILSNPPPFVFMTGTRDFKLTDAEVENLRKYLRMGGCVWGDSSVPGLRSRFDLAFKREMKRVIGNVDAEFEALPANHQLFQKGYFKQITATPSGLNFYNEPVSVLKIFGEVAVIYTANDYADMWQIGLTEKGEVDLRRNEHNQFVAVNEELWRYRNTYLGNLNPIEKGRQPAANLEDTYKFGANVIFHLLTRWDGKLASTSSL